MNTFSNEDLLSKLDPYIISQVASTIGTSSFIAQPEILDLEIDEITQIVRVKFWQANDKRTIIHPKAYIRQIIYHELANVMRNHEPLLPLPLNEHGELFQGRMILTNQEQIEVPSLFLNYEQESIDNIVKFISQLPQRQKQATLWVLKDPAKDIFEVEASLTKCGIDLNNIQKPQNKEEVIKLRASYAIALNKIELFVYGPTSTYGPQKTPKRNPEWHLVDRQFKSRALAHQQIAQLASQDLDINIDLSKQFTELKPFLGQLEEPYLTAIQLRYEQNLRYKQIAKYFCVEVWTARSYVKSALRQLLRLSAYEEIKKQRTETLKYINQIKEPYRMLIHLYYEEKIKYLDISKKMDMPLGTVKSYVKRGFTKLTQIAKEAQVERIDDQKQLISHITTLPEPYKATMSLYCLERLSCEQIASKLDIPAGTVKVHVHRGKKLLGINSDISLHM